MDRRQQKTRQAILAAFEELLVQKKYEHITVQDIIDKANIGRSTFYSHFETKDELLRNTCENLFNHIFADHPAKEPSHDFSASVNSLSDALTHVLYHLKDDKSRYARIFACESANLFWGYFEDQFSQLMLRYDIHQKDIPDDFYRNYYCSAFIEAIKWWFKTGLQATPEKLQSYFSQVAMYEAQSSKQ